MLHGIAIAIALGVRLALATTLGDESPYLFFVPAVLVAAGIAGLGPGLVALRPVVWRSRDISAA